MSLSSNVQSRYGSQLLINASNPQNSGGTTLDTARLALACTDVEAAFKVMCGVEYDDTVATHVAYAVEGVYVRLQVLTGHVNKDSWDDWKKSLKEELALVTGRDRIPPTSDSGLQATEDTFGALPSADRTVFKRYIPGAPNDEDILD